jgi:hypothetical protein
MNLEQDLIFAQVIAEQIDEYVHVEVLYYPVGSINGLQMPHVTLGNWLETEWRLNALRERDPARIDAALNAGRNEVRRVRRRADALYIHKARREFKSRLDTWEMVLREGEDEGSSVKRNPQPINSNAGYPTQVHTRLKLELLQGDVSQQAGQLARLRMADGLLRTRFTPGAFVWAPELAKAAPADTWWWLFAETE